MNKGDFEFSDLLDTEEGMDFIFKAVNFFVCRSKEKISAPFRALEEDLVKAYYEKYEFLYKGRDEADMELCHLLVHVASIYIDRIEDGVKAKLQFPFDCTILFDLKKWYDEIDIKNRYTEEIMILLINKLYESPYRKLIK